MCVHTQFLGTENVLFQVCMKLYRADHADINVVAEWRCMPVVPALDRGKVSVDRMDELLRLSK